MSHKRLGKLAEWLIATGWLKRPRLWSAEEWRKRTAKEKLWIWYKHHLNIRGQGSGEIDIFTNPLKDFLLYGGIILSNAAIALIYLKIEMDYFFLVFLVGIVAVVLWAINFYQQWRLGNWKDNSDLIALEQEIVNRRNILFREIRKRAAEEPFRKKI